MNIGSVVNWNVNDTSAKYSEIVHRIQQNYESWFGGSETKINNLIYLEVIVLRSHSHSTDTDGHMQEICLSAKRGKEVLKVPPEVP